MRLASGEDMTVQLGAVGAPEVADGVSALVRHDLGVPPGGVGVGQDHLILGRPADPYGSAAQADAGLWQAGLPYRQPFTLLGTRVSVPPHPIPLHPESPNPRRDCTGRSDPVRI